MFKKLISAITITMLVIAFIPHIAFAQSGTISESGTYDLSAFGNESTITIDGGLSVTLTNTTGGVYKNMQIVCGEGVTLSIDDLNIYEQLNSDKCALSFTGNGNKLVLEGYSILTSDRSEPGIKVEEGTALEINGPGKLYVTGGHSAAGIGSGANRACGNITISGGYIYASNQNMYGEGNKIGYGLNGSGGTLTISNDAILFVDDGTIIPPTTTHTREHHYENEGPIYGIQTPEYIDILYYVYLNFDYIYDLQYDTNSGLGAAPATVSQFHGTSSKLSGSDVLTKGSQVFAEWNTQADGQGQTFLPGDPYTFTADTILYAMYESVFTQGDGSPDAPYGISTPKQLNAVRYFPNANYIMLNDIDMAAATTEGGDYNNGGKGFTPIASFNGTFNGDGHKITGLHINRPKEDKVALFGDASADSVISHLGLADAAIYGGCDYTGGICAGSNGTIEYCFTSGSVCGADTSTVGGVAGHANNILSCYNFADVSMYEDPASGGSLGTGGIAGSAGGARNCYNAGSVRGCYDSVVGGILGGGDRDTTNCYNIGAINGSPAIAMIYNNQEASKLPGIYYIKVNDPVLGVGDGRFGIPFDKHFDYATRLTNEQMQSQSSFPEFDFDNVWTMGGDPSYPYPELRGMPQFPIAENTADFAGGNGLPYDPYKISTPQQLNNVREYLHGSFMLLNDIDLTAATGSGGAYYNGGKGFRPIGMGEDSEFTGWFDGNGHAIIGLKSIYTDGNQTVGLFTYCINSSIKNLDIKQMNIFGENAGGIVGSAISTQIENCHVSGNINAANYQLECAGGITAMLSRGGKIQHCSSSVDILSPNSIRYAPYTMGGIAGEIFENSEVSTCSFDGSLINKHYDSSLPTLGGIAGRNDGKISDCFNTGYIENLNDINESGITDLNTGSVERCYDASTASNPMGDTYEGGSFNDCYYLLNELNGGLTIPGASAKTFDEMQQQVTYTHFDFDNTWTISEGNSLPVFKGETFTYINGFSLDQSAIKLNKNASANLTATFQPADPSNKTIVWTSSDHMVATVENGKVTGVGTGTTTITARTIYGSLSDTCEVTVYIPLTKVTLNNTNMTLTDGDSGQLSATLTPGDATYQTVTWSSDKTAVATVDASGTVTAEGEGTATITASADGKSATCLVYVQKKPVTSVTLSSGAVTLHKGESTTLTATVLPSDATYTHVTWSSDKTSVASVDANGNVTAEGVGNATITARADGRSDTCTVTVEPIHVSGVTLNHEETSLKVGEQVTLQATVLPADATDPQVSWKSSDDDTATIDQTGVVTATGEGTATITATADGVSKTCTIHVSEIYFVVTFETNEGNKIPGQSVKRNTTVNKPDDPERYGYTFRGWYKDAPCSHEWDFESNTITDKTILYAKWEINYYNVKFDTLGGSSIKSQRVAYDSTAQMPGTPGKTNYAFAGWYKEAACINPWNFDNRVTADTTLYARWQPASAYISKLNLSPEANISPEFSETRYKYKVLLPEDTKTITITPSKECDGAAMTVNGMDSSSLSVTLDNGDTVVRSIRVTYGRSIRTYTFTITRARSTNNDLDSLVSSEGSLSPAFDKDTQNYTIELPEDTDRTTLTAFAELPVLTKVYDTSKTYILNKGQYKKVTIKVRSQAGRYRYYTIMIHRAPSSNNDLASLSISPASCKLSALFVTGVPEYTVSMPANIRTIKLYPKAADGLSKVSIKVTINGVTRKTNMITLLNGQNGYVEITVTSQSEVQRVYKITVTRADR